MIKYIVSFVIIIVLVSCGSSKRVVTSKSSKAIPKPKTHTTKKPIPSSNDNGTHSSQGNEVVVSVGTTNKIVRKALSYKGTKYKYGGTSKSGMDCSGLMYTSFKSADIDLPRTSIAQSKKGVKVSKAKAQKGDLVFFKTGGKRSINHVGMVVSVDSRDVKFVHSSSSRGVMISSLREGYWSNAFSHVRRIKGKGRAVTVPNDNTTSITYVVKKGDTLYAIARKYEGVSASNIIKYNKLSGTNLSPGMVLKIPSRG